MGQPLSCERDEAVPAVSQARWAAAGEFQSGPAVALARLAATPSRTVCIGSKTEARELAQVLPTAHKGAYCLGRGVGLRKRRPCASGFCLTGPCAPSSTMLSLSLSLSRPSLPVSLLTGSLPFPAPPRRPLATPLVTVAQATPGKTGAPCVKVPGSSRVPPRVR